jgi:type I restriction enzyme, S subunit
MSRKGYPQYKPSGVAWLGEIPEHWEVKALKRTFNLLNGSTPKSDNQDFWDGDIPWATPDDLGSLDGITLMETRRMITQTGFDSCGVSIAPKESLILSTRAPIGHLALAGVSMCTNQGCRSLVFLHNEDRHFFYYELLATREELKSLGQGSTFKELSRDSLSSIYLAFPPLDEQHAISSFLDRETARIDVLIEKKQRQIELLQEKLSALISHAVTKGLDPNAKMKDSGIEWLGEIPAHWEVKRLKYIASINDEALTESTDPDYEFAYVDIGSVDAAKGIVAMEIYRFTDAPSRARRIVRYGDTIVSTVRTYLRAIASIQESIDNLIVSTGFAVVRPRRIDPCYLSYVLKTQFFVEMVVSRSTGVSYPAINAPEVGNIRVPVPPSYEQCAITAFLGRRMDRIDALADKIRNSIKMLREHRTALISAAVTGKIDVRTVPAGMQEEVS